MISLFVLGRPSLPEAIDLLEAELLKPSLNERETTKRHTQVSVAYEREFARQPSSPRLLSGLGISVASELA